MKTGIIRIAWVGLFAFLFGTVASFGQSHSGSWSKKSESISGSWSIAEVDGKQVLSLKGFKTRSAPDLKIFLSPKESGKVKNGNATQGALRVAKLKSASGDQSYVLPAGLDLSKYKTVLIHCERFSKVWGVGRL
ncbi:MAG: DM13 domain-containing protein [Verrucomicrobiota bacterium]